MLTVLYRDETNSLGLYLALTGREFLYLRKGCCIGAIQPPIPRISISVSLDGQCRTVSGDSYSIELPEGFLTYIRKQYPVPDFLEQPITLTIPALGIDSEDACICVAYVPKSLQKTVYLEHLNRPDTIAAQPGVVDILHSPANTPYSQN